MKKAISQTAIATLLFISIIVAAIFTPLSFNASAETEDYYEYKANYIKNSWYYNFVMNDVNLPYRHFAERLQNNNAFQLEVQLWHAALFEFDESMSDITGTKQFKYYEAVLMDLLAYEITTEVYAEELNEQYKSLHVSTYKKINSLDMAFLEDAIKEGKQLMKDGGDTAEIVAALESKLKNSKELKKAIDILEKGGDSGIGLGEILEYVEDANDLIERLTKVTLLAIWLMGMEKHSMLWQIKQIINTLRRRWQKCLL